MAYYAGLDIGGTKLAASVAKVEGGAVEILAKAKFPTPQGYPAALALLTKGLAQALEQAGLQRQQLAAAGISCGGPLNSRTGRILSPPNLPGWDDVPIVADLEKELGLPVALQNDADACALAEWRFGAGRGAQNMVFLTFGTGLGAGLILNGRLYTGSANLAGELGHIRCPFPTEYAPVGYGKAGSFEGFCSGGGIAQLGRAMVLEKLQQGVSISFCPTVEQLDQLTAQSIAQAAQGGDPLATEIYRVSGRCLGAALAMLVDLLNPDRVVIGSIFARSEGLLRGPALEVLQRESLALSRDCCRIVPAGLGDALGDVAAVSVAVNSRAAVDCS